MSAEELKDLFGVTSCLRRASLVFYIANDCLSAAIHMDVFDADILVAPQRRVDEVARHRAKRLIQSTPPILSLAVRRICRCHKSIRPRQLYTFYTDWALADGPVSHRSRHLVPFARHPASPFLAN